MVKGAWYTEWQGNRLLIVNRNLGWNDNPIIFEGRVYYDFPERIPQYAKDMVVAEYRRKGMLK